MMINARMSVNEVMNLNPDVAQVFMKHGLNCLGCPGASMENLEEAAEGHGANLEKLIKDLNEFFNK